ncbi:MAG TPA: sulfatase [bacterium]|nr:sulfatase [bacterium]HQO36376.1 sulfatase [bacterium]HQP99248.1 sulfatase [bacterium]
MTEMNLVRRDFLKTLGLGSLALGMPGRGFGADSPKNLPNVVFILVDDMGWSDLACYGADLHETPNIDRFASQCTRFTDAYAASPVCTPTRASILTGKYPARLHMTVWRENSLGTPDDSKKMIPPRCVSDLPHEEITIAEVFKQAGYQTAHVGKWHLGDATHYPETQGFDVNIGGTLWGAPNTYFYPYKGSDYYRESRYVPHLEFGEPGEYLTDRLTSEALNLMEKMHNGPFFLNLAYHTVHTPIEGKPELVEYYKQKIKEGMRHQHPGYAAMVRSLDENVGRVLAKLDALGIADNTVVILFSDNGGYINKKDGIPVTDNSPLRSGKGCLYEGGIREPLMIRWPGVTRPESVCQEPVCSIDFYPTLLEITGLSGDPKHNRDVDGTSLVPVLRDPNSSLNRETLCWHYPHYYFFPETGPVGAIRQGDWKLVEHFEDGKLELFNLKDDLQEQNDLADRLPSKATSLHKALVKWREDVNAQMPEANPKAQK